MVGPPPGWPSGACGSRSPAFTIPDWYAPTAPKASVATRSGGTPRRSEGGTNRAHESVGSTQVIVGVDRNFGAFEGREVESSRDVVVLA